MNLKIFRTYYRLIKLLKQLKGHPVFTVVLISWSLAFLFYLVILNGWIGDDPFITLRYVKNWQEGFGPVWNLNERVQGYSHPLWFLLLSFFSLFVKDLPIFTIWLGAFLTFLAVLRIVWKQTRFSLLSVWLVLMCMLSKAFIDYSTSGLENSLSYLLIALYAGLLLVSSSQAKPHHSFKLSLAGTLLILNRFDLGLISLPPLIWYCWNNRQQRSKLAAPILIGFLPLILWLVFSTVYYGFPLPNTAYAKLNNGFGLYWYFQHGWQYISNSWEYDPVTLSTIYVGLITTFWQPNKYFRALSAGVFLYLLYTFSIGGDFMSGRYFAVPYFVSLITLASVFMTAAAHPWKNKLLFLPLTLVLIGACLSPRSPAFNPLPQSTLTSGAERRTPANNIVDEGLFYCRSNCLKRWIPKRQELTLLGTLGKPVTEGMIGMKGYYSETGVQIIDYLGLTDPFLARLPANPDTTWGIGHSPRDIPTGYLEAARYGNFRLVAPYYQEYLYKIFEVTRGNIFSRERLRLILDLNLNQAYFNQARIRWWPSSNTLIILSVVLYLVWLTYYLFRPLLVKLSRWRYSGTVLTASLVIIVLGTQAWHSYNIRNWMLDDAFITFRYVENWISGKGLVWNPGQTAVEGFTSPAWVLILAITSLIGIPILISAKTIGLIFAAACLYLTYQLAQAIGLKPRQAGLSVLFLGTAGSFTTWATSGMEVNLFIFALLGATLWYLKLNDSINKQSICWGIFWLVFLPLARPEGLLAVLLIFLNAWIFLKQPQKFKQLVLSLLGALVILGVLLLVRFSYYHAWLPNTFYAKVGFSQKQVFRGLDYFKAFWLTYWPLIYVAILGTIWRCKFRQTKNDFLRISLIGSYILFISIYVITIGGDAMPSHRFLVPTLPFLAVIAAWAIGKSVGSKIILTLLATAIILNNYSGYAINRSIRDHIRADNIAKIGRTVGEYMGSHFLPDTRIATNTAGSIPYYSGLPSIDMYGLNDAVISRTKVKNIGTRPAGHEKANGQYVLSLKPDIILFGCCYGQEKPDFITDFQVYAFPDFGLNYQYISVRLSNGAILGYYRRK